MARLKHFEKPAPSHPKNRDFRLFECMRERRYQGIVRKIKSADKRLEGLAKKREALSMLPLSAQESVVNGDESNWDEAMAKKREAHSCRKILKSESRTAAFLLFSEDMFKAGLLGGAAFVLLGAVIPGFNPIISGAIGALCILATIVRTSSRVLSGSQEYLDAVAANLDEQEKSLGKERTRLIRKLHGWKGSDK